MGEGGFDAPESVLPSQNFVATPLMIPIASRRNMAGQTRYTHTQCKLDQSCMLNSTVLLLLRDYRHLQIRGTTSEATDADCDRHYAERSRAQIWSLAQLQPRPNIHLKHVTLPECALYRTSAVEYGSRSFADAFVCYCKLELWHRMIQEWRNWKNGTM